MTSTMFSQKPQIETARPAEPQDGLAHVELRMQLIASEAREQTSEHRPWADRYSCLTRAIENAENVHHFCDLMETSSAGPQCATLNSFDHDRHNWTAIQQDKTTCI